MADLSQCWLEKTGLATDNGTKIKLVFNFFKLVFYFFGIGGPTLFQVSPLLWFSYPFAVSRDVCKIVYCLLYRANVLPIDQCFSTFALKMCQTSVPRIP